MGLSSAALGLSESYRPVAPFMKICYLGGQSLRPTAIVCPNTLLLYG